MSGWTFVGTRRSRNGLAWDFSPRRRRIRRVSEGLTHLESSFFINCTLIRTRMPAGGEFLLRAGAHGVSCVAALVENAVPAAAGRTRFGAGLEACPSYPKSNVGAAWRLRLRGGRRIARVWCARDPIVFAGVAPAAIRRALEGRRVEAVCRWGKQLWFDLDERPHPLFHFGMSGAFRTRGDDPLQLMSGPKVGTREWPPRFAKIRVFFDDGGELAMTDGRRLGRILLRDDPREEPPVNRLGFDPLLAMPGPRAFAGMLQGRGRSSRRCFWTSASRPGWATG